MLLLDDSVAFLPALELLYPFLLANQFVFHLLLVTISGLEQLLGFLVGNVGELLGALLLEDQPLYAVLERSLLELAVPLHVAGLEHADAVPDDLSADAKAVIHNTEAASCYIQLGLILSRVANYLHTAFPLAEGLVASRNIGQVLRLCGRLAYDR